ncbi:prepilin-type N-terminal cleavage/methylation domain-containing protein [Cyanobium sp. T1B-Tous]|uniref:pilus assembly FimT family protein n=1 Tax=Cyanobium sp. T1B-Tous TaxID=2823721 RepID=UPI0020CF8C7F|nr:prepilin-type N-terminal cleavage/methylation domain-containing protein [Cyanobium sp. T1B-Tous]MCP9806684.1 prepilin-type N-terminal cleavage/methylation domain-containing protein [Cyanobium sp. T1B-Tous]
MNFITASCLGSATNISRLRYALHLMRSSRNSTAQHGQAAFSLIELLVVIAIIGIVSSVSLGYINSEIQKSRLVALTQSMAAWLEANRSKALAESTLCRVQFSANGSYSSGQSLASITPECAVNADFESQNFVISRQIGGSSYVFSRSLTSFDFTKRGLSPSSQDQYLSLSNPGSGPVKCIKINKYSGLVQIGSHPSSSSFCTSSSSYSASKPF